MIIPFDVTIPEAEQDKQLHVKIIDNELSGVFNWVLEGLKRLLAQKKFSDCDAAKLAREQYEKQSDNVKLFIEENGYVRDSVSTILIKLLYEEYKKFCIDDGYRPLSKTNFIKRLKRFDIFVDKKNSGNVAYLSKSNSLFD